MKTALFTNFTDEEFTGFWDGKAKKFKPGQSLYMPDYLANHFAKHLANRELLRRKPDGTLVIPNGEKYVSPKKPEDVPVYMDLFNKAYTPDDEEDAGNKGDDVDTLIQVANKNRSEQEENQSEEQDPSKPQVILPPDEEDDDESSFKGKPIELETGEDSEDK